MQISNRPRRLLVSIHDVSPAFEDRIDRLSERLAHLLGGARFTMLVVPDFWRKAPLARSPGFQRKLRRWSQDGVEMLLHGWSHRDESTGHKGLARLKANYMTAREGEFLALSREEATQRLREGRAALEDALGRPVTGFVAPAWLYGDGARAALADEGFEVAEDHLRVWRPSDGRILARGPVIGWASRSRFRLASSLAFAALARHALKRLPTLRIALHPGDQGSPALLESIDRTVRTSLAGRRCGRYGDLAGELDGASAGR
jgi:predicted deacetylase